MVPRTILSKIHSFIIKFSKQRGGSMNYLDLYLQHF